MIISQRISNKISDALCDSEWINENEKEIYAYCFDYVIELLLIITGALIAGILTNRFAFTLIFLITMVCYRSYGGGIHASSPERCSAISILLFLILLYSIQPLAFVIMRWQWSVAFVISMICILCLAPVDTPGRPMNTDKKKRLRKRCRILSACTSVLYLYFYILELEECYTSIALCVTVLSVCMLLGYIRNQNKIRKELSL